MILNIENLGQVFTPAVIVQKMLSLRKRAGRILEPAAGNGSFLSHLEADAVGIELDRSLTDDGRILHCDFFEYSTGHKFDTIIGNPPYVRFRDIPADTKQLLDMSLFDRRSNLYLFFIEKCIDHLNHNGELIFITPRDFIKATASRKLNHRLYEEGSITHYYDLGDASIFKGATPNCAIWRWQKGLTKRTAKTGGKFRFKDGQIWFGNEYSERLGDYFDIKVGAVSGADRIFSNTKRGCTSFVCSTTVKDNKTRRMIFNKKDNYLLKYKDILINRRIRKFDESNWWQWGRKYHRQPGPRIYVNCKTRNSRPFFASTVEAYDGSVLGLFPKRDMDVEKVAENLNRVQWDELGFVCDGRLLFTQRSLENAPVSLAI